jgi:hypothetical protein
MSDLQLDPRALKVQNVVKYTGVGLVAVATSGFVVVTGASVVVAGLTAIAGIAMVNLVPVVARSLALWKQKSLTALTEAFSEETIREDEGKEAERVRLLESQYITSRSELEGAQEELRKQLKGATPDEESMLQAQIDAMEQVIIGAQETLKTRKEDFIELQRVNKLYIALHRSAAAMEKVQGAERNVEEIQRIETARNSIKTRMRAAMAGKTIEQMDMANRKPLSYDLLNTSKGVKK